MFLAFTAFIFAFENGVTNPSFEQGLSGWARDTYACNIDSNEHHSGSNSLYCKVDSNNKASVYQFVDKSKLSFGLYYKFSAWIKMKKCTGRVLVSFESADYMSTIYLYNTANNSCSSNDCGDKWYYISTKSLMIMKEGSYSIGIGLRDNGVGEFWLDDLSLTPIEDTNYLVTADINSYRQEVFDEKKKVIVSLSILKTVYENGENMGLKAEFINEATQKVELTVTDFVLKRRLELMVAELEFDPTKLTAGYYEVKVTFTNYLMDRVETVSTHCHKLSSKRNYKLYIDDKLRVIDNGKPFFPLGLYVAEYNDNLLPTFVDSPFNLIKPGGVQPVSFFDNLWEKSNHQIRAIDNGAANFGWGTNETMIEQYKQIVVKRAEAVKNSPGLFAYYLCDEPSLQQIPSLFANCRGIREVDYDHFIWGAINNRLYIHKYKEALDTYGIDIYPCQHYDDFNAVHIVTYQARNLAMSLRANWGIPQIFDWTIYDQKNELPPTRDQLYNMVYQMIAEGANGLIFYDYSEGKRGPQKWEPQWENLKSVVTDLRDNYVPIILSDDEPNPEYNTDITFWNELNEGRPCAVRFFRYNNKDYILAVNPFQESSKVCSFNINHELRNIKVIRGSSTFQTLKNNTVMQLTMPKMDVCWLAGDTSDSSSSDGSGSTDKTDSAHTTSNSDGSGNTDKTESSSSGQIGDITHFSSFVPDNEGDNTNGDKNKKNGLSVGVIAAIVVVVLVVVVAAVVTAFILIKRKQNQQSKDFLLVV